MDNTLSSVPQATLPRPSSRRQDPHPGGPPSQSYRRRARWVAWWHDDRGSAAAEATLVTPLLIVLLLFVAVVIHRGVDARLRLNDAAHQAARAASIQRSSPDAMTAAQSAATTALPAGSVVCASVSVDTATGGMVPGGVVTVTVTCSVNFGDGLLLGVPGQKVVSATASEPIDTFRSTAATLGGSS